MADEENSWKRIGGKRGKIISYVKSPLGFYTLALLIVESFLLGTGALFGLSETMKITALFVGVFLFLGVVVTVTALVIKFPQLLVFSEESHLEWEYMHVFGDSSHPMPDRIITVPKATEQPEKPAQPSGGGN
jgi:hypothetical protein